MYLSYKYYDFTAHVVTYLKQLGVSARTMVAPFLCHTLQNNNVKSPDSALSGEHEPPNIIIFF